MKPKPTLTALLALVLSGGLLWAFPTLWMTLLLVLLALFAAQTTLIRRSLKVVLAAPGVPPLRVSRALETDGPAPGFTNLSGSSAQSSLDPAAFARFRAHLESVEQQRGPKPAADLAPPEAAAKPASAPRPERARATPAPAAAGQSGSSADPLSSASAQVEDRVALSAQPAAQPLPAMPKVKTTGTYGPQRRVVMPGAKLSPTPKIKPPVAPAASDEPDEVDLFEDLRPNRTGALPARRAAQAPPDVLGDAMAVAANAGPSADEANALLRLAQDAGRRSEPGAARAALDQHLSLLPAGQATPLAYRLQARFAALDGQPQLALDAFEAMLKAGFALKDDNVQPLLDELLEGAPADVADSLRVSLLLKVLGVFRQATDRPAMDHTYRLLIAAQERVGDERKLVQFLKNHLEIRKVMGEVSGQLEIIDEIGNRLFKLGQTAEAREFYELGLKLRAELKQADPATPTAKTGTTPQTA